MKKITLLLVTLFATGTMLMAQGEPRRGGRGNMNMKERAERMTERMVKAYSLNDTQKQQIYEANLVMIADMQPSQRPDDRNREGHGMRENRGRKNAPKDDLSKEERDKGMKEPREKRIVERQKSLDSYNAKLKSIFSKEQYDMYMKKQAERQQRMNERRRSRA